MPTPAPRALQNLGPLVFGNDALNLQQELVLRCTADRPVQEHDLGAAAAKLLDQEHLVGVASRQPVRRVHVNAFDLSASHRIAQLLQRRFEARAPSGARAPQDDVRAPQDEVGAGDTPLFSGNWWLVLGFVWPKRHLLRPHSQIQLIGERNSVSL